MFDEIAFRLKPLRTRVAQLHDQLEIGQKRERYQDLEAQSELPEFWEDPSTAQKILKEKGLMERTVKDWEALSEMVEEVETLIELGAEEADEEMAEEAQEVVQTLENRLEDLETRRLLSGELDENDVIVEVNAGAGGTDAADWAELLLRMYRRWAERQGFKTELLDLSPAEEAGIRGAALAIRGPYAYGYMQAESGVHRLVRISPFDQNGRRQTAFAAVNAIAEIDDDIEIDINPADIEMETMRASGAGGQHVNTTDSAVRLRHVPSGVVVLCRAERSQHKNRDKAMKMLRAKLYQIELEKRMEAAAEANAKKKKIDFGSQIRSYVMHPYQQVKDLRTGETVGDVSKVLDGDVTGFMTAWLAAKAEGRLDQA